MESTVLKRVSGASSCARTVATSRTQRLPVAAVQQVCMIETCEVLREAQLLVAFLSVVGRAVLENSQSLMT